MKSITTALTLTLLFSFQLMYAQDTSRAQATLKQATVYFGHGAELTHQAKVTISKTTRQIIINQLATQIDPNSLQISVPENVALLSQRFQVFTPETVVIVNPLVKKWNDSIQLLQKDIARIIMLADIEQQTLEKTGRLIEVTINNSGNKTVSSDEALKLINAYTAKIEKSKLAIFKYTEDRQSIQEKINGFNEKISNAGQAQEKPGKPYGQLILQVMANTSGEIPVTLSYFTNYAGFTPMYDVRVNTKTNELKLVYKAAVSQTTGIDWKQTKLTLSTANPNWGGVAPVLQAWYLQTYVPQLYRMQTEAAAAPVMNTIQSFGDVKLQEVITSGDEGYSRKKIYAQSTTTINPSNLSNYTTLNESQLNTNFEIDLPYDIMSTGEIQSVTIKEERLTPSFKNYAVPKLDRDAYLIAELTDWQNLNLLPGVANIIMDDTYIGKSSIDPNVATDTMNLSLGRDKRIAVNRQLIREFTSTKRSGNNTKQTFTYEITVKNNKTTDVNLLLKDQYPLSTVKEIEVNLENSGNADVNSDLGILNWKIQLKPGESKKIRFSYTVKYPSNLRISNL